MIVIGGGFAGLAAATALAEAGVAVHLIEARPTLGGRANTFRDPVTNERIDNGQHVLAGCYAETLLFLKRIGSADRLHCPSTLSVPMIQEDGRHTELRLPPLPAPFDLIGAVLAWEALTVADRWSIVRLGPALRGMTNVCRDETVRQWLDRHGQPPRLRHLLWEPLALAALNQPIDQAAAASFVAVTARMFGSESGASTLLLPAVPLDELYALPAKEYLARNGATVSTRAKANVVFSADRVCAVRVGETTTACRAVICTVPWFAVRETLSSPPHVLSTLVANAVAMRDSPIVTVNLWYDSFPPSPLRGFGATGIGDHMLFGLPGRTFQWVFARHNLIGERQTHLSLVSSGADAISTKPSEELVAIAHREIADAMPELRAARLRHAQAVRERRATFSLHPSEPPRPGTVTTIPNLLMAGDWIDTGLPATIESAVVSGHKAAKEAMKLLGSL